ncbi:hypothetical protein D3C78_1638580 [compost metagenome]
MGLLVTITGIVGLLALVIFVDTMAWGYVCFKFWHWFIMPAFTIAPNLNFWQCVGIMFFIALFKNHSQNKDNKDEKNYSTVVGGLLTPWLFLAIAYFFS